MLPPFDGQQYRAPNPTKDEVIHGLPLLPLLFGFGVCEFLALPAIV
jgi:hypothetical protein